MTGPFDTERQAREASSYAEGCDIRAANLADLRAAVSGLDLGDYDSRIIGWLAGWEPAVVAVVYGLIGRARETAGGGS